MDIDYHEEDGSWVESSRFDLWTGPTKRYTDSDEENDSHPDTRRGSDRRGGRRRRIAEQVGLGVRLTPDPAHAPVPGESYAARSG